MHSYDYEKRILKPTTLLAHDDVWAFVQSFGHLGYQRQVDFNQVTCSIDDLEKHVKEIKPYAGLGDLLNIKSRTSKRFIFMPILEARGRNSGHFSGVAVDIEKRLILFYDSHRRYAFRDKRSQKAKAQRVTERVRETMLEVFHSEYWRGHELDFISQTDVTSCGVFLCFFFECVAIGVDLEQFYVQPESEEVPDLDLEEYRAWIAFSICMTRNMGVRMSNTGVRSHQTGPVEAIEIDLDDDDRKSPPETMVPKRGGKKRTGEGRRVGAKRQTTRRTPAAVSAAATESIEILSRKSPPETMVPKRGEKKGPGKGGA